MNIVSLNVSNFMKIEAAEITPEGNTIILSGPNGAGKSTVIDSFVVGMSGKALNAIHLPVRQGADSGKIVIDLGDIIVTRKFTNEKSSLVVENNRGMVYKSPQKLLDGLMGIISFDPMQYASLSDKQQKEVLLSLINLPIDIDELDKERKELYDTRTLVNRDIKQLTGQMEGIQDRLGVPDDEISTADITDKMKAASEQIAANENKRIDLSYLIESEKTANATLASMEDEIKRLQEAIGNQQETVAQIHNDVDVLQTTVDSLIDPDLEQFKCQIEDAEIINQHVREKQERRRLLAQINETKANSLALTVDMTAIDELKDKTIQGANMPVPGLGFDENGVTFEGIPLSQRSDGEKRKISARIGMALNPDLKVLWLKDASLLDDSSMQEMKDLAEEHEYQLWMEVINDMDNVAIHIEDGRVVT